jgi:hypothetical protein
MKSAIHYDAEDIKKMLAEKHGVEVKNVIRNQYSYTVVLEKDEYPNIRVPNGTTGEYTHDIK